MSTVPPVVKTKTFTVDLQPQFVVDNLFIRKNQDNHNVLIVDLRTLDQSKKLTKHPRALTAGNIPGSIKFPFHGLYMAHAQLKPPQELLWVLKNRGITLDKTVVITCNTGAFAGAGFFMLRYLSYPDVRMHDAAFQLPMQNLPSQVGRPHAGQILFGIELPQWPFSAEKRQQSPIRPLL